MHFLRWLMFFVWSDVLENQTLAFNQPSWEWSTQALHAYHALLCISSSLSQFPTRVCLSTHFLPLKDTIYFLLLSNPVLFTVWKSLVSLRWAMNSQITWHPHWTILLLPKWYFYMMGRVCVILFLLGTFRLWPSPDWVLSQARSLGDWPYADECGA